MSAGKRLAQYIEYKGFTKKSFCEKYSFDYNNMVNVFAGKREIGMKVLNQIKLALPDLSVDWLLYEVGNPELTKYNTKDTKILPVLEEPSINYSVDHFEKLLLEYLEHPKIKNKINEIAKERNKK